MKFSIVIPTYNHCNDLLKPCIESILKYTDISNVEIVVSANGCTDETSDYVSELIKKFPDNFKLVWNNDPVGFTKATNEGIKTATGEFVVLLNNDTEVLPSSINNWLDSLERPFKENNKTGIAGPLSLYDNNVNSNFIVFWCAMVRKSIFDEIGLLDEIFNPGFGEDIDFSMRLRQAGYDVVCLDKVETLNGTHTGSFPMVHKNNKTFGEIKNYSSEIVKRNQLTLRQRYNTMDENLLNFKIGVITPVYNDVEFIQQSLNSVSFQSFPNITHYLYHDCGIDASDSIIENFQSNKKIKFIRGDKNRGQSYARNELIKLAIQDGCTHLAFLDADDTWNIDHVETSLKEIEDNDVVYSTPNFVFENGSQAFPTNFVIPREFVGKNLKYNNFIWISSVLTKVNCFVDNQFDSALDSIEDWDMWCRLYDQSHKFKFKKSTSMTYTVKSSGSAAQGRTKMHIFNQKHQMLPKLKLHLACGHDYDPTYINIDLYAPDDARVDFRHDVRQLPYEDNSVDEIKAFHIIEHFDFFEGQHVLKEWYRILKPGGKLYLETPDFLETCRAFVEGSPLPGYDIEQWRILLYGHFFAHPWVPGQTHKFLFTESQLRSQLGWAGFKVVNRVEPASKYVLPETRHLFLTVDAYK